MKHFKPLAIGTLSDTMLQAMEGAGDKECKIIRIKQGRELFYDLTKDDDELREAFQNMGAEDIPDEEEENADDLSIASMETVDEIRNEDAT